MFILAWYLSKYFKKTRTSLLIFPLQLHSDTSGPLYGVIRICCFIITYVCTQVHVEARGQLPVLSLSCDPPYFYNGVLHWDLGSPMRLGKSQESPSSYFPSAGIVSMSAWWILLFTTVGGWEIKLRPSCVCSRHCTHSLSSSVLWASVYTKVFHQTCCIWTVGLKPMVGSSSSLAESHRGCD